MQLLRGKHSAVRAIDANVLVRFLTADNPVEAQAARGVIGGSQIFIGTTVMLETEWILRAGYRLSPPEIAAALRGLGGLTGVTLEEPAEVAQALDWMAEGMDFADALHLARSGNCGAFVTFDRKLAQGAKVVGAIPVEVPS